MPQKVIKLAQGPNRGVDEFDGFTIVLFAPCDLETVTFIVGSDLQDFGSRTVATSGVERTISLHLTKSSEQSVDLKGRDYSFRLLRAEAVKDSDGIKRLHYEIQANRND
jgi:hypothetical protein